jgi:hypothetical protein
MKGILRRTLSTGLSALLVPSLIGFPTQAFAQERESQAAQAASATPPDVVLFKNGGMVRGTISEMLPQEYVVIALPSGDQRRFSMKEVKFAGPASGAPKGGSSSEPQQADARDEAEDDAAAKREPPPDSENAEVRFQGPADGVRFHIRTGQAVGHVVGTTWSGKAGLYGGSVAVDAFNEVCTAPCTATLQKGSYTFGLSEEDGRPVVADTPIDIDGPTQISGTYTSYRGLRIAGIATIVVAGGVGLAMMWSSSNDCDSTDSSCEPVNGTLLWGGAGITLGGGLIGLAMAMKSDEADVRVGTTPTARPRAVADTRGDRGRRNAASRGLTVPIFAGTF